MGELQFESGYRTEETVDNLLDQANFTRGCPAFLRTIIAASMFSFRAGLRRDLGITSASQLAVGEGDFDAQPALVRVGDHSPAPPGRAVGVAQPPPAQPSARR